MESGKPTQIPNYTQSQQSLTKITSGKNKTTNQSGLGLHALESEDEEDSDSSSSSSSSSSSIDLEKFRQIWKREIEQKKIIKDNKFQSKDLTIVDQSRWNMAKSLYKQGTRLEKAGELLLATQHYRHALKLEPDIDQFPMDDTKNKKQHHPNSATNCKTSRTKKPHDNEALCGFPTLVEKFSSIRVNHRSCMQEVATREVGFSDLPPEVIVYIFRWVVGENLDLISLERLSLVSRGFYVLARDEELWHSICVRIWGRHCTRVEEQPTIYNSWRSMACHRARVAFNGCYLSRNTYVRCGEATLGISYSPFYLVEYFRAYRFYPDGQVVAINSPDCPAVLVKALANQNTQKNLSGLLIGYYVMEGRQVTCVLQRVTDEYQQRYHAKRKQQQAQEYVEHTYRMEFQIKRGKCKPFQSLVWKSYIIVTHRRCGSIDNVSECEIPCDSFPSLQFSRVKSYESDIDTQPL